MAGSRRYMSKSQRACDFCRSRRAACQIEASPPCKLCQTHSRDCTFERAAEPRKPRRMQASVPLQAPGISNNDGHSLLSGMEGIEATHVHASEVALLDENWVTTGPDVPDAGSMDSLDPHLPVVVDDDILHQPFPDLSVNLNPSNGPPPLDDGLYHHFLGPTSEHDPNLLRRYRLNEQHEIWFKKLAIRMTSGGVLPTFHVLSLPTYAPQEYPPSPDLPGFDNKAELEGLVANDVGERLIELFMKMVNPYFPIFCKESQPHPAEAPDYLLSAIYLATDRFFSHDDYLCIQVVYDRPDPRRLFQIAWEGLSHGLHRVSIPLMQAAMILVLCPPIDPLDQEGSFKWSLLGTLVSMAETMGLHEDPTNWNIPLRQINFRRRLAWMVYALDTWLALSLSRPPHISKDNWTVSGLEESHLEGACDERTDFTPLLRLAKLTALVNSVLRELFSIRATQELTGNFRKALEAARPLLVELSNWNNDMLQTTTDSRRNWDPAEAPNQRAHLQLAYYAARLTVIRALLRTFDNPEVDSTIHAADRHEFSEARQRCREAAKTCTMAMTSFISSLTGRDCDQFWPSWSSAMFALAPYMALLVVVTSTEAYEAGQFKSLLSQLRRALRTQSRFFDTLRLATLRLDAHFWRGLDNVLVMDSKLGLTFDELVEVPLSLESGGS